MRKKEEKLMITFHTTADAIAFEKVCRDAGRPGRMIPVPRELSAGCGLAWCAEPKLADEFRELLENAGIECEAFAQMLY